jgi:hypothetical protein
MVFIQWYSFRSIHVCFKLKSNVQKVIRNEVARLIKCLWFYGLWLLKHCCIVVCWFTLNVVPHPPPPCKACPMSKSFTSSPCLATHTPHVISIALSTSNCSINSLIINVFLVQNHVVQHTIANDHICPWKCTYMSNHHKFPIGFL